MSESALPPYEFRTQLAIGQKGEHFLDDCFSGTFEIVPASDEQQRKEIDRIWRHRKYPQVAFTVEYKTDRHIDDGNGRPDSKKNVCIEIVSNDTTGAPGWAIKSEAEYLVYLVWETKRIFVLAMSDIRRMLPVWMMRNLPIGKTPNPGYTTHNVLVPIPMLKPIVLWDGNKHQREFDQWFNR